MTQLSSPEEVRRRIFLLLLPLAAVVSLALGVHGLVTGRVVPWAAWSGIGVGVLLAGFALAFVFRREGSRRIEIALVVAMAVAMAGLLVYGALSHDEGQATAELIRQGIWLPVIYGVGFLVLPPRVGSIAAWSLWSFQALASSSHLLDPTGHSAAEITTLAETLIANAVVILVLSGVARVVRATERRAAGLEIAANTDTLTRIANRRSGERRLEDEVERSIRYDRPLSVVLFDLDLFKRINDTFGHDVGDEVLRQVPQALAARSRESDLLVRWGGEEFLVIAPEMGLDQATRMTERFRALIEEYDFGIGWQVTASFGVAQRDGLESGADVVRRADEAMYAAKRNGRNGVWRSLAGDGAHRVEHVASGAPTRTSDRLPPVTVRPARTLKTAAGVPRETARTDADDDPPLAR
jgi:diguanylate cyclase (GGDEF)-like protein